jgi:hypothetical protein
MGMTDFFRRSKPPLLAAVAHNDTPSQDRIDAALALGASIIRSAENRTNLISELGIDAAFAMPAADWDLQTSDYVRAYRLLSSLTWDEIRFLRLRCQFFTGTTLLTMSSCAGGPSSADPIPWKFETQWDGKTRDKIAARWRALTKRRRHVMQVPNILGECGWWIDSALVNADVVDYQERINLIDNGGLIDRLSDKRPRILEIGGGYGALAYALASILNPSQYVICDLPESLLFSGLYLSTAQDKPPRLYASRDHLAPRIDGEICLLPNYLFQTALSGESFDLVINTLSMSEMSPHQVSTYGALISKAIGRNGDFFEQNFDMRFRGLIDCKDYLWPHFRRFRRVPKLSKKLDHGRTTIWSN